MYILDITHIGVGGIDKYSTTVFLEKKKYCGITTYLVLQAPLNNMLQSS